MANKQIEEAAIPAFDAVEGFKGFKSEPDPGVEGGPELTVAELVEKKRRLDEVKKKAEEELAWTGGQLVLAMAIGEVEKVKLADGGLLKIGYGRGASKIEPTLLLQQGVTVEQIQAATKEGKPYSFVQVVEPKAGKPRPGGGEGE